MIPVMQIRKGSSERRKDVPDEGHTARLSGDELPDISPAACMLPLSIKSSLVLAILLIPAHRLLSGQRKEKFGFPASSLSWSHPVSQGRWQTLNMVTHAPIPPSACIYHSHLHIHLLHPPDSILKHTRDPSTPPSWQRKPA